MPKPSKSSAVKPAENTPQVTGQPSTNADVIDETLSRIKDLMAERDVVLGKCSEHKQQANELVEDEKSMMQTSDPNNPADFKKFSDLRLKREMMPAKIESLRSRAEEILYDLKAENTKLITELMALIAYNRHILYGEVCIALKPLFLNRLGTLRAVAWDIVDTTNYYQNIKSHDHRLRSETIRGLRTPIQTAVELTDIAVAIKGLSPFCNAPGRIPGPRTSEEVERDELEKITKNPEPFIEQRMMFGKLTREAAEKAVANRKKHLEQKVAGTFDLSFIHQQNEK